MTPPARRHTELYSPVANVEGSAPLVANSIDKGSYIACGTSPRYYDNHTSLGAANTRTQNRRTI